MLKRVLRRVFGFVADNIDRCARLLGAGATLLRLGPRGYVRHRATLHLAGSRRGVTFANGVTTVLTPARAQAWHHVYWQPLMIAVYGNTDADVREWMAGAHDILHARFLLAPELAVRAIGYSDTDWISVSGVDGAPPVELNALLDWMHRSWRRWDLIILDAAQTLPDIAAIMELQHAAHQYHHDKEVGFATPAYRTPDGVVTGYEVVGRSGVVEPALPPASDYGQANIARYVLTAPAHGFYATSSAIDRVDFADQELAGLDLDSQVGVLVRRGWAGNTRTLCFSSTVVDVDTLPVLTLGDEQRRWLLQREVCDEGGRPRIIFVLNATTVSGGIRAVFEIANGLAKRGFAVEIWSLEKQPEWFDLAVPVRSYRNYEDLLLSLRNVDAIKVATWWETAEVVWLASVNHGIPVYLIQEFETWFYPDDRVAQAAVVASYRREFASVTEASYQQQELADVRVAATLIPHGYDSNTFRELGEWTRDNKTLLAVGRSFFQKNFAMTERAWRLMGESRPKLLLFGSEPEIVVDERVEYHKRPRDEDVNKLYNTATLFVQTSRHEGFCLPVLEAMAAGCPVITTDSHGNRDFCRDGVNCVIVDQDDDAGLAAAITRLLANPDERERLRVGGRETARIYAWPVVLDEVAQFYSQLAVSSAGHPLDTPVYAADR